MRLVRAAVLPFVLALAPTDAEAAFASRGDPSVTFTAIGPAGMQIVGTTKELAVQEDAQGALSVTVTLGTLTTGISLRDKHMREKYLETPTYPTAVLKVARTKLKLPAPGASGSFEGEGTMTLHGRTKPVTFRYTAKSDGKNAYVVTGAMKVDMNDYGVETPKYLGVSVKPQVDLAVSFTAEDRT